MPGAPGDLPAEAAALEDFYSALLEDDPELLYDRAPCGYLSTAPDGTIVKVNQTFLTWTGHAREDLVGRRRFADLLTGGGRIYHETHYAPLLQMHGTVREIALEVVKADGRRLPVLVNATLDRFDDGEPRVVRVAVFEASERRTYERELLLAKRRAEESESRAAALATTLQQTLIPPSPPNIPGLDVAAAYRPAGDGAEVGGDFYDIFQVGHDDWVIALGDVCGKGVGAAVVTTLVRYSLRALCVQMDSPADALLALNDILLRSDVERFTTLVLLRLRLHPDGWRVTFSLGGHPLPLLLRPLQEPECVGDAGSLVGAVDSASYSDTVLRLEPGDTVVLYTDGVPDGRRGDEMYGDERIFTLLTQLAGRSEPAASLVEGLTADVVTFQSGLARDDIAVVAIHVPAGG